MAINPDEHDRINRYIRDRVKEARLERGMSQDDLALYLGKTRVAISNLERGQAQVNAGDLAILAKALEKPISYFYPEDVAGPTARDLSPTEKGLVQSFRGIRNRTLQEVAVKQVQYMLEVEVDPTIKKWMDSELEPIPEEGL